MTKKIAGAITVLAVVIVIIIIFGGMVPGCGKDAGNNNTVGEVQLTIYRNRILVGTDETYPPFEFVQDGETVGFDIDIASEIAARMEKELEIVPITWDFTYKIPEDIKLDMIISAVSAEEDKLEFVDFSDPYYTMEYILIVLSDAELTIKEDLKGKKVGMIDIRVKDLDPEQLKDFTIEEYKEVLTMLEDLRNRDIAAVLVSAPVGKNIIEENDGIYRILQVMKSNRVFNMVFHKDSPLTEEVNSILADMEEDGTYQEIHDSWFSLPGQ